MKMQSFKDFLSEEEKKKTGDEEAYQKYFNKMLKKWGVDSPEDLSDADKKKFFDAVDKGWESDKEQGKQGAKAANEGSLEERSITIKDERQLLKALQDLEVNLKGKARTMMSIATEELEDKGLDHDVASKIEDAISVLPGNFSQNALVDAVVDYVEENL